MTKTNNLKKLSSHCERCKKEMTTTSTSIKPFGVRMKAIWLLIQGGIINACELCDCIGVHHSVITPDAVASMRLDYVDIQSSVRCCNCNAMVNVLPCVNCTVQHRAPRYRV